MRADQGLTLIELLIVTVIARATINGSPVDSASVALNVGASPRTFVSFAPNPINTTNGGGNNQSLQFPQDAVVTFSGDCSGITSVQLPVDRGDDGSFTGGAITGTCRVDRMSGRTR